VTRLSLQQQIAELKAQATSLQARVEHVDAALEAAREQRDRLTATLKRVTDERDLAHWHATELQRLVGDIIGGLALMHGGFLNRRDAIADVRRDRQAAIYRDDAQQGTAP
jgi:chromosome segregation ATPase